MPRKLTNDEYIAKASPFHPNCDYSESEYLGNDKPIKVICRTHGPFYPRANDHLSKRAGCPACAGVKRLDTPEFRKRSRKKHGNKYGYDKSVYVNTDTKVIIICFDHGDFLQTPHDHLRGAGCPTCAGVAKKDTIQFKAEAQSLNGTDKYDYDEVDYRGNRKKVWIRCIEHDYRFQQSPIDHLRGQGCPICAGNVGRKEDFEPKAVIEHDGFYGYEKVLYTNKSTEIEITCPIHGSFWQTPNNHLLGAGCPKCSCVGVSRSEEKLAEHLSEFSPVKDRSVLGGRELDLYFPEKNVAVEVNGIYWHSDAKKPNDSHKDKTSACSDKGVKLLHFTETEVDLKLPIVVSMVRNALGASEQIYARKCSVRVVAFKEYSKFFTDNHISGSVPAKVAYGLYLGEELISCMSFSKPRFDKSCDWEILRFASKCGFSVVGAGGKLFAAFVSGQSPKSVMTYADLRYGTGAVYECLGFSYSRTTEPGYAYHHKTKPSVSRIQAQKHKLQKLLGDKFVESKTEKENMLSSGYHRMYDCGHRIYIWNLP